TPPPMPPVARAATSRSAGRDRPSRRSRTGCRRWPRSSRSLLHPGAAGAASGMSRVPYRGARIAVDSDGVAQGGAPVHDGVMVVDSDGHLVEHSTVYDGRIDPRHLEHAPRVLRMEDGQIGRAHV